MEFMISLIIYGLLVSFLLKLIMSKINGKSGKLPPGPRPLPLIGNLLKLGDKPHESLADLAKTYGPLMSLKLGQKTVYVISSLALAKETFKKQDLILSNRSVPNALQAYDHFKNSVVWMPVSDTWRKLRKIMNMVLLQANKLNASQILRRKKVDELIAYADKCCRTGVAVDIRRAAFITSLNMLSNTLFSKDLGEDFLNEFVDVIYDIQTTAGKANLADFFPALQIIDPQGLRHHLTNSLQKMVELVSKLIDERIELRRLTKNNDRNDVLDTLLNMAEDVSKTQIERLLTDMIIAGTDTTSSTIEWAMAEVLRNPEVLKMVKAELEETIGKGKPIEETDISQLPYLQAVVKETLRMHPPTRFNMRIVGADFEISQYRIPKGAEILVSFWAMCRDPDLWESPTLFDPTRFMSSKTNIQYREFELIPFGFGRRACPGVSLAFRTITLMVGSLLNSFEYWKLESGTILEELDMEEDCAGLTLLKAQPLRVIPIYH